MKRNYWALCGLLAVSLTVTSCLSDNSSDSDVAYSDAAITAITLGSLNCYTQTTSSETGNDTIIKTVLTGSNYYMTVDQVNNRIYNNVELPLGTDLAHVLLSSISTKNNSITALKDKSEERYALISSSDSIDFSTPRILRVYSSDLTYERDYTMTLTASKTDGMKLGWKKTATDAALEGWTDKVLVAFADSVRLVDRGIVVKDSIAYRMNGTTVQQSRDLVNWDDVSSASLSILLGTATTELFALGTDGKMKRSEDNGVTWQDETLDEDVSLLPVSQIAMTYWNYSPIDSTDYVLMAGTNQQGDVCLWRKVSQYGGDSKGGQWVFMPIESDNHFVLTQQNNLSLVYLDKTIYALGSDKTVYTSRDQGITWHPNSNYALPDDVQGTEFVMTSDSQGNLWLVTNGGQVWKR